MKGEPLSAYENILFSKSTPYTSDFWLLINIVFVASSCPFLRETKMQNPLRKPVSREKDRVGFSRERVSKMRAFAEKVFIFAETDFFWHKGEMKGRSRTYRGVS